MHFTCHYWADPVIPDQPRRAGLRRSDIGLRSRESLVLALAVIWAALLPAHATAQSFRSHLDLDWHASRRWVHVDHVDPRLGHLFEGARKDWLTVLRRDGQLLGDGRPLFWYARGGDVQTYYTFYPFGRWADLDARNQMITRTDSLVGEEAVNAYDRGDSALVPPHCSQIWRRVAAADIAWSGCDSLTELNAAVGRMEFHQIDWWRWEEFEKAWDKIKAALIAQKYPLACRVYANSFGDTQGEYILLWLAPDSTLYGGAPTLPGALAREWGDQESKEAVALLNQLFPLRASYEIERRLDLSNLGK
jgi:hypothetical protein